MGKIVKKIACGGQNSQKNPAAGKILKKYLPAVGKIVKKIACSGQNTQKNSPLAGKILK